MLFRSINEWNSRRVNSVLALDVAPWEEDYRSPLDFIFKLGEVKHAIYGWSVLSVDKNQLEYVIQSLGPNAMEGVAKALGGIFSKKSPTPAPNSKYPQAGQVRFADLAIEGEGEKPVVIVSGSWFAQSYDFSLVVACRITSNGTRLFDFDVKLDKQPGKVVCSDVMTLNMRHVRERSISTNVLSLEERSNVLKQVYRILGIKSDD